jgi:hypothetical protein
VISCGRALERSVRDGVESCLRRARGAGRTKPPEEHYAEADRSSGRWTKAFPARRTLRVGRRSRPVLFSCRPRACVSRRSSICAKRKERKLRKVGFAGTLTELDEAHRVRFAPSTEHPRLMALRSAPASAEVSWEAGRRRHRLGAFSFLRTTSVTGVVGPPRVPWIAARGDGRATVRA